MMKNKQAYRFSLLFSIIFILLFLPLFAQDYQIEKDQSDIAFYSCPKQIESLPLSSRKKVKNIILMIGDGMSFAHIDSARIKACGSKGRLNMERMPVTGLVKTHSNSHLVTDSAAAATALAAGTKTYNGAVSVNPEKKPILTILEACKNMGKATGLVVTCSVTHATPAAFASHVPSRKDQNEIATQLLNNKVNVLLGGGLQFFLPKSEKTSKREDDRNLILEAIEAGYEVVRTKTELDQASNNNLLGLFEMEDMKTVATEPSLAEMTLKALDILSQNKDGFFLMVEGSQIDWGAHDNDENYTIRQVLLFDEAIYIALDFALKNKDTLVVVTADHETGGMSLVDGSLSGDKMEIDWTTKHHSALQVPLFAFGPRASIFTGVLENIQVPVKLAEILKIKDFPGTIP